MFFMFQFQCGTIKSFDAAIQPVTVQTSFNSNVVRLKVTLLFRATTPADFVSIPMWYD